MLHAIESDQAIATKIEYAEIALGRIAADDRSVVTDTQTRSL